MTSRPLVTAGIVLGMGFAAFFDGIVLHQILGWHHLICTTATCRPTSVADLQQKNTQDGYFHLFAYFIVLTGTALLFHAGRTREAAWSGRSFFGSVLAGAGLFNVVEGIIDHHILQIHHVRPGADQTAWDLGFLACSLIVGLIGFALLKAQDRAMGGEAAGLRG